MSASFSTLHVRPVSGLQVLDPVTYQPLPASGRHVPNVSYWRRALKQGRVERVPEANVAKLTKKTKQPSTSKADTGAQS